MKLLIIITILVSVAALLATSLLILSGGLVVTNSPISRESVVNDASVYASTNQTAIDQFLDNIDISGDPAFQTTATPKFTILTNLVMFDSNGKEYPKTIPSNVELAKNSLVDDQGRLLDLGSVQFTFDGIGTVQNKNLEISATALFCLDNDCNTKKLYRQGTLQNNKISLYVGDSFTEPPFGQRKFDYTFTFADEKLASGTDHFFKVILKDITFRNFATDEKWLFVGEDEIYSLKLAVDGEKTVVYDEQLQQAVSIFKKDNVFQVCADSGSAGYGVGNAAISVATTPDISINVNNEFYDKIVVLRGVQNQVEASQYFLNNHIFNGGYSFADICKSVNLPRNAKVDILINSQPYTFFTPKSQANFFLECHNRSIGVEPPEIIYGRYVYTSFTEKYMCTSNIGYSK